MVFVGILQEKNLILFDDLVKSTNPI